MVIRLLLSLGILTTVAFIQVPTAFASVKDPGNHHQLFPEAEAIPQLRQDSDECDYVNNPSRCGKS